MACVGGRVLGRERGDESEGEKEEKPEEEEEVGEEEERGTNERCDETR